MFPLKISKCEGGNLSSDNGAVIAHCTNQELVISVCAGVRRTQTYSNKPWLADRIAVVAAVTAVRRLGSVQAILHVNLAAQYEPLAAS